MRAFTTVFAGILMASPVAGLRPMRAFRFCTTSFTMPGKHELAGTLQLLLRERRQLIEELARLRTFHFEPFGEVRKQLGLAHASGVCHHVPPVLMRADRRPRYSCARSNCRGNS